jgi:hypothetical protein
MAFVDPSIGISTAENLIPGYQTEASKKPWSNQKEEKA